MSAGKVAWSIIAGLAVITLFVEIWGAMFGWLHIESRAAFGIGLVCVVLAILGAANIDPPAKKRGA